MTPGDGPPQPLSRNSRVVAFLLLLSSHGGPPARHSHHQGAQPEVHRPDHPLLPRLDGGEAQDPPLQGLPQPAVYKGSEAGVFWQIAS